MQYRLKGGSLKLVYHAHTQTRVQRAVLGALVEIPEYLVGGVKNSNKFNWKKYMSITHLIIE